jgi:hypothetical protein
MRAKSKDPADDGKPRTRNRKEVIRDEVIQIRVSGEEKRQIKATHGRGAAAVARAFLLGHPPPRRTVLQDSGKLQVMHAIYAHSLELRRTRFKATKAEPADLLAQLDKQEESLSHLLRVCYSNFSQ